MYWEQENAPCQSRNNTGRLIVFHYFAGIAGGQKLFLPTSLLSEICQRSIVERSALFQGNVPLAIIL